MAQMSRKSRLFLPTLRTLCSKVRIRCNLLIIMQSSSSANYRLWDSVVLFQAVIDRGVVLGVYEGCKEDNGNVDDLFTEAAKNFNIKTSGRLKEVVKL